MKNFTRRAKKSVLALIPLFCLIIAAQPLMVGPGLVAPEPMGAYLNGVFPNDVPTGSTGGEVSYSIENAFPNLTFIDPVDMVEIPDMNEFIVIGLQGHVWKIPNTPDATEKTLLLDLSPNTVVYRDGGMLGVLLHPEFGQPGSPNSEYMYLFYRYTPVVVDDTQVGAAVNGYMRLSRFNYVAGTNSIDPGSEYVLIQVFDRHDWHNGGDMFFGNDSFLYVVVGDEGAANDSYNVSQQIDKWLFSGVLRIDVDMQGGNISHPIRRQPQNAGTPPAGWPDSFTQGYYIPNDNPWLDVNGGVLEEFYAIGTRSPHRMTYDTQAEEIWIGDVGQGQIEEVDVVRKGDNLQWPYMEGTRVTGKAKPSPLIGTDAPPIFDYNRSMGNAVIGGSVYRGNRYPELKDKYFFGDHGTQNVWTLERGTPQAPNPDNNIVINAAESASGWGGSNSLSVSTDAQEGNGSVQAVGSATDDFRLNFGPVNGTGALKLEFWYYVSDVSQLTDNNQVELGSAGGPDVNEYHWNIPSSSLVNGWNYISLPLNSAGSTGGVPDVNALNWFRLYRFKNGSVTSRIDYVHLSTYDATPTTVELLLNVPREGSGGKQGISSFFVDSRENIFILDLFGTGLDGGKIHRIVRNSVGVSDPPQSLSELGAFSNLSTLTTAPGIIPYDVNAPLWSDRAEKLRWIALPNDGTHDSPMEQITFDAEGNWQFPPGTVFIKHFELPTDERDPAQSVKLETRFLVFTELGDAYGVTYRWNEAGTDAFLIDITAEESRDVEITALDGTTWTQTWDFPSRQQCMQCHTPTADFALGVRTRQLNKDFHYTETGITGNQLETWNALSMFDRDIGTPDELPASAHILDNNYSQEFRVRSYIDANCSFCHRPGGAGGTFDGRGAVALNDQGMINNPATSNGSPIGKMVVHPGQPSESVLWIRDASEGADKMPPIGRRLNDPDYISTLSTWIQNLSSTAPAAITDGWYHLQVKHTGKLASVENASTDEKASVVQADEVTAPEQQWFLEDLGNQKFRMKVGHSDMVMALRTPQAGQGVEVVQETWTGEQQQMWYFQEADGGYYTIVNAYSSLAIEVPSAGTGEGLALAVAQSSGGDHQLWLPIPTTPVGPNDPPVAVASATPTSGVDPLTVTLDGRGSTDSDGNIVSYSWREGPTVLGSTDVLIVDFNEGIHEVILEVTDDRGAMEDDTVTITVAPPPVCNDVPAPWQVTYIGSNDLGGTVCYDNGTFSIQSAGADIWNASDHFRFVHQPLGCDGEVVARVQSLENTNAWAKAGVMIRESLDTDSRHAMMIASYSSGLSFQYRPTAGGTSSAVNVGNTWPKWVRIQRQGDTFTGSFSDDAVNWTVAGSVTIAGMAQDVFMGMAVTSHNTNAITTGVLEGVSAVGCANQLPVAQIDAQPVDGIVPLTVDFDGSGSADADGTIASYAWDFGDGNNATGATASHTYTTAGTYNATLTVTDNEGATGQSAVQISVNEPVCDPVPAPWQITYIGSNDLGGEVCYDNGTFSIQSAGYDIWNANDAFRFVHQPLICNGTVVARVQSIENTNDWAKAGVMIRESTAPNSRHAMMIVSYSMGISFQYRAETGGISDSFDLTGVWPTWVKVDRQGDTFIGSYSADGTNWTVAGQIDIPGFGQDVLMGLAVTAHNADAITTGVLDNVSAAGTGCPNNAPVASLSASAMNGTAPLTVFFDGSGSTDSDGSIVNYAWDFGDGNTATGITASHTYTIAGTYNATLTVTDDEGAENTAQTTITVDELSPNLSSGVVSGVGSSWQTVIMPESYASAVIIATPSYTASDLPAVTRIRNVAGNSFELKVENPSGTNLSGYSVYWVAAEEGVYSEAAGGVNMEVVKYTSAITDRNGSWNGEARSYINSYANPVVLGQVLSDNDIWSSFWSRGTSITSPPNATTLYTGKMVAEDNLTSRANETIGYIVVEAGSYTLSGQNIVAALGADVIRGTTNSPPYSYAISGLTQPTSAVATMAAMDGNNGGWAYFYGANPITASGIGLAIDEDMIRDTERAHTTEQVAYVVVEGAAGNQSPIANAGTYAPKTDTDNSGEESFTLDGTASTDPDGSIALFEWDVDNDGSYDLTGPVNDASFSVAGSPHTAVLRVTDNEGATHQDAATITVQAGSTASDIYWLEAECGNVGSNWDILSDAAASEGNYVVYPSGNMINLNTTNANNPANQITFDVDLEAGVYHLFFRVNANGGTNDSFWVQVDDGSWIKFWRGVQTSGFQWKKVSDDGNDVSFNLTAGVHTIKVVYREDGTLLDKLVIKKGTDMPSGLGDAASNCGGASLRTASSGSTNNEVSESLFIDQITALVYPNPVAKDRQLLTVDIKNPDKGEVHLQLFDLYGRTVINKKIEMMDIQRFEQFDLSAEADGAYYMRIKIGDWEKTAKVIIK